MKVESVKSLTPKNDELSKNIESGKGDTNQDSTDESEIATEKTQKALSVKQQQEEMKMLAVTNEPKNNSSAWLFGLLSVSLGIVAFGVWMFSRKKR